MQSQNGGLCIQLLFLLYCFLCTLHLVLSDTFDITAKVKACYPVVVSWWRTASGCRRRAGVRYLGLSRTHLKDLFEASRSGRWKSWHSTLWHHQNTTPSQHSAALMAVLKGTFKYTDLQVAAGMVRVVFVLNWTWMNST